MTTWKDFFTNEAIASYLIFLAGLLVTQIVWLIARYFKKATIIKIEKRAESSLIDISDEAQKRLLITYNGNPITAFHQTTFEVVNNGEEPIQGIELSVKLDCSINLREIYEVSLEDSMGASRKPSPLVSKEEIDGHPVIRIITPYMNPQRGYDDILKMHIYSLNPVVVEAVHGGGLGWGVKYVDRVAYRSEYESIISGATSAFDLITSLGFFVIRKGVL